jgi:MFS family permease
VTQPSDERFPIRLQALLYSIAGLNGASYIMVSVIIPLWALELSSSPFLIGLIISSRQFLVVTMGIYGGALLDRYGPRRVIMILGVIGAAATGLFPVLPFIAAAIILQLIAGFCESTNWVGAQALVGRMLKGQPVYVGRMTFALRVGAFGGPIATGLAWEYYGPGAGFALVAIWMLCGAGMATLLPKGEPRPLAGAKDEAAPPTRGESVMPQVTDYASTFRLLILPAVALVIAVTFMRQTGSGVQNSFYPIWLAQIGFTAGSIGLLIGITNGVSALGGLVVGPLTRRFAEHWLLLVMSGLAIIPIAMTPSLGTTFVVFAVAIGLRGAGQGINFPLLVSIASRAVGPELQGRVAALRLTFNRFGGALVPVAMGAMAELVGLANAFYLVGLLGLVLLGLLAIWVARTPEFKSGGKSG